MLGLTWIADVVSLAISWRQGGVYFGYEVVFFDVVNSLQVWPSWVFTVNCSTEALHHFYLPALCLHCTRGRGIHAVYLFEAASKPWLQKKCVEVRTFLSLEMWIAFGL